MVMSTWCCVLGKVCLENNYNFCHICISPNRCKFILSIHAI